MHHRECASPVDPKHRSPVDAPAPRGGGAVQTALRIEDQAAIRHSSVTSSCEAMQHSEVPSWIQLVGHTIVEVAAVRGGAIQIAMVITRQISGGELSLGAGEGMKHRIVAAGIELEDYTASIAEAADGIAAQIGCAVNVAASVQEYVCRWKCTVLRSRKTVEHCLCAGRIHLENSSVSECAPGLGCAVEITGPVEDHTGKGTRAVGVTRETVQDCFIARAVQLEYCAEVKTGTTSFRGAIEVARAVPDYTFRWRGSIRVSPAQETIKDLVLAVLSQFEDRATAI